MTELLTAAGIIVTVLVAYLKIQKEHANALRLQGEHFRNDLQLQEEHLRNELKLRIYQEITVLLDKAAKAFSAASSLYRITVSTLRLSQDNPMLKVTQTSNELLEASEKARGAVSDLMILFDRYEIVFARFSSIQRQFGDEHRRLIDAGAKLTGRLLMHLPREEAQPATQTVFPVRPTAEAITDLEKDFEAYLTVLEDLKGYLLDAQVEAQNELLGELFGRRVPPRNPADPSVKVLTRDAQPLAERPKGRWV